MCVFVFLCWALKHSGRLIKSVPQAAAPTIGSHSEKYPPSHITGKRRSFELFFALAALLEGKRQRGQVDGTD